MTSTLNILRAFLLFGLAAFYACSPLPKETQAEDVVKHLRVIWTENPSESCIVSWTAFENSGESYLLLSTDAEFQTSVRMKPARSGAISLRAADIAAQLSPAWYHHVVLEGLIPNTRYYLRACEDGQCTELYYFRTANPEAREMSLLSGGDSRLRDSDEGAIADSVEAHNDRRAMNKLIRELFEADTSIMALAHGADYCLTSDWRYLNYWFNDWELTTTADRRLLPLIISRGNHDHQIGFTECFWLGELSNQNSEGYYYYTQITDRIALITLNTETSMAGYQRKWLSKLLPEKRGQLDWLMAQYHKPAYPAVKDFNREDFVRVRTHWVPLFEAYGLDLALESDGHALKRTAPIKAGTIDEQGIVYIGEGGLGVPQRTADSNRWYFKGGKAISAHHVWKLDFCDSLLHVTALGIGSDTLDYVQIAKRNYPN